MKPKMFNLSERRSQNYFLKVIFLLVVFVYFSLNGFPSTPGLWKGNTADWHLATNWDDNSIPDNTVDVLIPTNPTGGTFPIVSADADCRNLTVEPLASITIAATFTLNVNGSVIIKSNITGTGALLDLGTLNVTGTTTIERYINGVSGYHYISNSVKDATLEQIDDDVALRNLGFGYYDPANPPYANQMPNIWKMDETHSTPNPAAQGAWLAPNSIDETMTNGRGYALVANSSTVIDISGAEFNTGDINFNITRTAMGGGAEGTGGNGWHIIGNPYPSPLDWNAVCNDLPAGVSHTATFFYTTSIYYGAFGYYHPIAGPSGSYPHNRYIPSNQGLYINTTVNNTITFKNTHRTVATAALSTTYYKSNKADKKKRPILRVKGTLLPDNGLNDATVIFFDTVATTTFNGKTDAYKLMNTEPLVPNIYSMKDNKKLSINGLPEITDMLEIPIGFEISTPGAYTIDAYEITNFPQDVDIFLEDRSSNNVQNLRINPVYTFNINKSADNDRFVIRFELTATKINKTNFINNASIYTSANTLYVNLNTENKLSADVEIYNVQGQKVAESLKAISGSNEYNLNLNKGCYIINLRSDKLNINKKVYFN
ncbi:MAG: T9SS type A sorting domain-containing protein [Bacteroidales bacterium]|nr:T9SS type A sorting domain-containing protein [Bacteroidales bacterium]